MLIITETVPMGTPEGVRLIRIIQISRLAVTLGPERTYCDNLLIQFL